MNKVPYQKLEKIAEIVIPKIINHIIVDTDHGYLVFNQYYIERNNQTYTLIRRGDEKEFYFNRLKNAITYAILHKNYKMHEATRVYELDNLMYGLLLEQKLYERRKKKTKIEDFIIIKNKIQNIIDKCIKITDELDKYIIVAKDCQQKGFEHEINRTKRK